MERMKWKIMLATLVYFTSFNIGAQTYLNISTETNIELTQTNINSNASLTVTTNNWQADKTYCGVFGTFYNMSSTTRHLNIDVSNVDSFDIYIQNSTENRQFKVTVGEGTEQTITHGGANCQMWTFNTNNTGNIRIKLGGGGSSVYPSKIVLYPTASCTTPSNFTVSGSTAICSGSTNVTLSSSQIGVTYALFKDNALVESSETAGTGNALNWSVNESGTYSVRTTTAGGYCEATMTGSAIISIDNAGPAITSSNLTGVTYNQNETATALSVTATAATTYQWYSNPTASNTGGTLINDATNASYIPLTSALGTNYYYVVVSGPCGDPVTSSISGAIIVTEAPPCNVLRLASDFTSGVSAYTFSSGDILRGVDVNGTSVNLPNRTTGNICGGATYRVQLQYVVLEVKSTNVNTITIFGTSNGSSLRTISKLEVGSSFVGTYNEITNFNVTSNTINTTSCGEMLIENLDIPVNSFIRIAFSGNVNLSGFDLCALNIDPSISLTSGANPITTTATLAMTPVIYSYEAVENDANVLFNWYTDNTYTSTTTAPNGLSITKDTGAKTVTVSGTPTTAATYYYKVAINETGGNEITGSVIVEPYITPSPTITLTSAANTQHQSRKAGTAISNITYSIANATGATVSTLPAGLSGNYSDGTFTISGTIDNAADLAIVNFTVTATALSGYAGEPITATGSISVKSPTAKEILYLNNAATVHANDTQIFPNINNNVNYIVTIKQTASSEPTSAAYDNYDLIMVSESVGGSNAELIALKNINKPILNFKSFAYNTGRWNWGTGNDVNENGTINIKQPNHPIFNNITLNDGSLELLSNTSGKAILSADVNLAGSINVALGTKTIGYGVAIHDVPANIRGVASAKYLLLSISIESYNKITPAGLTLINNAIDYLLNGTQFEADPLQYRTSGTGNLSAITWESSYDGTNWSADVQRPQTGNNSSVRARAGSALNINSEIAMEELVIEATAEVNVLPTQKLTLTQGMNNAGTLRLQSNSSGTATVLMPAASNSGNTFVEQYLPQGRNWYVGAPVQTSSASVLTAENLGSTVSYYNEPTAAWVNNYSGALTPGKGYVSVSSVGSNTANAAFEGTLNNGEITVELTRKGATKAGFNLIANPYPSYLNAMAAINANSNVETTIWYRTRSSAYHFETVNTASGVGTNVSGQGLVTGYIPPMQAFWVRTTADEQSITFNNGMRHHATPLVGETTIATTPLRAKAVANTVIRLRVENATNTDEMVIYTHAAAQNAFDKFDSQKMSNDNPSIAEIHSIVDGRQLVINGLNEINSESTIALGIKANAGNNLRISASEMLQIPSNCDLILLDKHMQTEHLLSENTYYAFEHINNNQRFDLIFRAKGTTTNTLENKARNLIYVNGNKQIVISNNLQTAWAHVYNLAGQMVHSELLNKATTILQSQLKPGVYIVSIDNAKQKIVIE